MHAITAVNDRTAFADSFLLSSFFLLPPLVFLAVLRAPDRRSEFVALFPFSTKLHFGLCWWLFGGGGG